ncbi:hypothetical protein GCM10010129_76780 [Streptomyces fumigatiscleroticus]|nr:hypothetical protein GCM10010129_76780 [Streptomyces fumigatiscleroticus]
MARWPVGSALRPGYLSHTRQGRANAYRINPARVLRHPAEAGLTVASLLALLVHAEDRRTAPPDGDHRVPRPAARG